MMRKIFVDDVLKCKTSGIKSEKLLLAEIKRFFFVVNYGHMQIGYQSTSVCCRLIRNATARFH